MFFNLLAEGAALGWFESLAVNYGGYIAVVLAFILFGEKVAALTPNKTDDKVVTFIRKVASFIALKVPDVDRIQEKKPKK